MNPTPERRPVRRALISVYDKNGLGDLARGLHEAGVSLVSTGSTAARITEAGVPVTPVEEVTGFAECLDGRVKTLHPGVHAGLLADTTRAAHLRALDDLGIEPFDLVVVNLYPFAHTVASGADRQACIEQIDIGGPAMVRSGAKNHLSVAVVVDPAAYGDVVESARAGGFTLAQRRQLAARAFAYTAAYDVQVASWMAGDLTDPSVGADLPRWLGATWDRAEILRYGENPHQGAALYTDTDTDPAQPGLAQGRQLQGKAMSYNNWVDADAARRAAHDHGEQPTVAIVKHANPCGIAIGADIAQAHRLAHACDPVSAYGGVVATNGPVSAELAEGLADIFTEVVVAPSFEDQALEVLARKKNLRLIEAASPRRAGVETRPVSGGLLVQQRDTVEATVDGGGDDPQRWRLVAGHPADEATLRDLSFAWRAVRAVKSNAILLALEGASVGIGMGQVNRVDSCHLAVRRAGDRARGAVASSDAFFPFADGLQVLLDAGVRAVVAPGGSIRDDEVLTAAQAAGVSLYFTGTRHFAH